MLIKLIISLLGLFGTGYCLAQEYKNVNLHAGTTSGTSVPSTVSSTNTVLFKGENEVVISPDFYTSGYTNASAGDSYFRAYLVPPTSYAELKKELDATYYSPIDKIVYFKYEEKYVDGILNYQIYNYQRTPMVSLPYPSPLIQTKRVGSNFLAIDLRLLTSISPANENESYYTLEVQNDKGEKWMLRFKYPLTD